MTVQKGVLTHAHCKMVYILKGGDTPVFLTIKFHLLKTRLILRWTWVRLMSGLSSSARYFSWIASWNWFWRHCVTALKVVETSHKWKETYDVDVDPFDETTLSFILHMGEFFQTSNGSLLLINCWHQYCFQISVSKQVNTVDCGLFTIEFIHNMFILGSLSGFTYTDWNDSNLFYFDNVNIHHLRKEMKKLIISLEST